MKGLRKYALQKNWILHRRRARRARRGSISTCAARLAQQPALPYHDGYEITFCTTFPPRCTPRRAEVGADGADAGLRAGAEGGEGGISLQKCGQSAGDF